MTQTLFTIGYEGRTLDDLMGALREAETELLIDVRAIAASRRPGFSKTALSGALREAGIDYLHLRALGTPKPGREAARRGRAAEMRSIFEAHLDTPEAELAFEQAHAAASERRSALLCFERDPACCHRTIVAERLVERSGFAVRCL
jgi:uncharacterized protein (DUF488 family)